MKLKESKDKIILKKNALYSKLCDSSSKIYNNFKRPKKEYIYKQLFKIVYNLFFLLILIKINIYIIEQNNLKEIKENLSKARKGIYAKINTAHKSKYTKYNYKENIIVKKDLFDSSSFTVISESNFIIKTKLISNETYFNLCKYKTLLDQKKYKRNLKPKISVIIPLYNKNKFSIFIPLRSIQNQSLKDVEIIFVDDGSSKEVLDQIMEEMKNDNRIILLIHKENKGTLMTRVDGVRYASGEYILNLDQDDLFTDNLFFEKIFIKAKELNVDILQFSTMAYNDKSKIDRMEIKMPANKIITQPELKTAFLEKIGENRYTNCATRMIWDKLVKREIYNKAINDLGDEYLNHRMFLYEDTLMMFELSQVAYSYYFYDILGYRLNTYNQGKSRLDNISIIAMNQLYFIKLLLYKFPPQYDRYHIFKEWGFGYCGSEVRRLNKNEIDLLKEVLEVIDELERKYGNTCKELLKCVSRIKKHFKIV